MAYHYSRSTGGFYVRSIHPAIPADAVEVTADEHAALLAGQALGKQISPDETGRPTLIDSVWMPPQIVSRFQARAALHLAGLLPQVETLIADPATDPIARLAWADAQEFRRTSPTVLQIAASLGLTESQLDELFTTAAGIEA